MSDNTELKNKIESAWENITKISPNDTDIADAVNEVIKKLDNGQFRIAEKNGNDWIVNQWLKKAVLISFRINDNKILKGPYTSWYDKVKGKTVDWNEDQWKEAGYRHVPNGTVREGSFIGKGVVLMPSFVNIGAYIDEGTMVDTWATVGSCAQIGKNCHLSGGVGIGGVLEPLQANPVIIEDNCFIGARSEIAEGVIVEEGAVISMGVYIGASTKIIDRETGNISIQKVLNIVETVEDPSREITLKDANSINKDKSETLKVGDKIYEDLPQIDFGRIAAQSAKQVINSKVREAEKNRQYEDFIDKQGLILSGIIKRLEYGNVIVDLGRAEGVIKKDELIPREVLKTGERVKAYCYEVKKEIKGHQIFLSRAHPQFLAKLFFQEVPEIYEGVIEIKSVARDPGSRAKICVYSKDTSIDPVGACVGMRGSRVQTIVNELHGEKIDIIKWTEDLPTLISESLSPAEIQKVLIDQTNKKIDVILSEENLSKAIGRRGQNVRLASKLTNFEIDILTDKEDSERRQTEFKEKTEALIKNLEVDETLGQLLVSEGFQSIEEISQANPEDISKIEAIDEETAKELISRSKESLIKMKEEVGKRLKELGVEDELINLKGMTQGMLVILGQKNIKKLSDFADLSTDELVGGFDEVKGKKVRLQGYLEEFSLTREEADQLIMSARDIVFK